MKTRPRWSPGATAAARGLLLVACVAASGCGSGTSHEAARPDGEVQPYRRAVGGLGAGYLFQTHLSIGTVADLFGQQIYEAKEVTVLMDTAIGMGRNVDAMLDALRATKLGPADTRAIDQMMKINRMLSLEAEALRDFARERSRENASRFANLREQTWNELRRLLDVERPPKLRPAPKKPG